MSNTDERYWSEYTPLQHAKHQLLGKYLNAWFPILASAHNQVIFIDCHAGRGRHTGGQPGSAMVALQGLLNHQHRARILESTEVHFIFFEKMQKHYDNLCEEIQSLGKMPKNIRIIPIQKRFEEPLYEIVKSAEEHEQVSPPIFAFVDPYGFDLSMNLLNRMLKLPRCELLINFMYRYINMAINQPVQSSNMDSLFGCRDWTELSNIDSPENRGTKTIALFSRQLQAQFVTHMNMMGTNNAHKYVLLHASNHRKGRNVMKESMWAVVPDGSFTAYERDNADQLVLIEPKPDLRPLKDMLWKQFAGKQVRMEKIDDWSLHTLYREKHVQEIIRDYQKRNIIDASGYSGRFGVKKSPLISFHAKRPADS